MGLQGALFSAINTSFIAISILSLTPDPGTETNALLRHMITNPNNTTLPLSDLSTTGPSLISVLSNCFLFASLCCSLLAAMAGMLGKEWLQSFDHAGQDGSIEHQVLFRQERFNGIQQWHLEGIVQLLPNLLILSVLLFFVGLFIFLFPISKPVAFVVVTFVTLGVGFSLLTTVAAAVVPLCPFQTALSAALRHAIVSFLKWMADLAAGETHPYILPNTNIGVENSIPETGSTLSYPTPTPSVNRGSVQAAGIQGDVGPL